MPALVLADSSIQPNEANLLLLFLDLLRDGGMQQTAEANQATQGAKHSAPRDAMDCVTAGEALFF
jgi:hypothetical protein